MNSLIKTPFVPQWGFVCRRIREFDAADISWFCVYYFEDAPKICRISIKIIAVFKVTERLLS